MSFEDRQSERLGIPKTEVNLNLEVSRLQNENLVLRDKTRQLEFEIDKLKSDLRSKERALQDCMRSKVV